MSEEKKSRFNLYNYLNKDGKGVPDDVDETRNFSFFFKLTGRKFGKLVQLNLLYFLANFPLFFVLLAASGYLGQTTTAPSSAFFANLFPLVSAGQGNPVISALYGVVGIQGTMMINTPLTFIFYGLGFLLLFTFGFANLGVIYNLRNIVKGQPLFMLSDFRDIIKRNWKQGLLFGILDALILVALVYDMIVYSGMMRYAAMGIFIVYFIMRFYIYILIPTFQLSLYKVLKNSLLFVVLNIKRNVLALLGIVCVLVINFTLLMVFYPLGFLMPLAITLSLCMFIGTYAAWPSIQEIMIDPYVEKEEEVKKEKPIFRDHLD
ncbi:MAG: YesL family protein [Clostridiales bacterium]|nr:YesL family protein [Clostridiales bacterium]